MPGEKLKVSLIGKNGNVFAILGECNRVMRKAGVSKEEIDEFTRVAMSGDYDHVLRTVMKNFEVS